MFALLELSGSATLARGRRMPQPHALFKGGISTSCYKPAFFIQNSRATALGL